MAAGVADRAAIFAALGEPVRLALVDRLILGDAAPGELAAELGLSSNLLAHHLRVLESAGVIDRTRSEGDRRRHYVRLRLGHPVVRAAVLTGEHPAGPVKADGRVVFVCTANSARSQLAAAAWNRRSLVPATSAGTHPGSRVHPRAVATAGRHGLDLSGRRPTGLPDRLDERDLVIAVCDNAHEELAAQLPRLHWSIPDPVPIDTDAAFERAYAELARRVADLAATVPARSAG